MMPAFLIDCAQYLYRRLTFIISSLAFSERNLAQNPPNYHQYVCCSIMTIIKKNASLNKKLKPLEFNFVFKFVHGVNINLKMQYLSIFKQIHLIFKLFLVMIYNCLEYIGIFNQIAQDQSQLHTMENQKNPKKQLESGAFIPYIGYGTYQLKGKECQQGVKWALQAGYTHIDTASCYRNQEAIGKVLSQMKVDRKSIFITSKVASTEQGYKEAIESCNNMLKKLNCGYLDLLIIHWPGVSKYDSSSEKNREVRRETWKALIQLKKQGKVRDIGVSNFLKHHLQDLLEHSQVKPAINQFELNPLLWQQDTINFCKEHKIAIQAYSPLARFDVKLVNNKTILSMADKYKKSVAQICLKWALQHDFIVIPKSKTKERIIQNFTIFDFKISSEDMAQIDKLRSYHLRTCWDPNSIIY